MYSVSDGSLKPLGPANVPTSYDGGEFTPDGKSVLVLSDRGGEFERLIRIDVASGAETVLDDGHWGVETFDLSRDGKVIAYATNEDGISRIALRDFKSGKRLPAPPLPNGVVVALSFSPDSKKLAINLSAPNVARDVWTWTLATHRLERWTDSELGGLDPASFADPKLIHFKSFDGLSIPALVYAPKATAGRHPVIVYLHGGPDSQERPDFYSTYQYWVKELGATVIAPNIRGSSGYGRTYVDADNGYKRENVYKDLSALLDWINAQPDMDSRRVVFFGGSAAGLLVLGGLARFPDRVAGGVDIDGISDITSFSKRRKAIAAISDVPNMATNATPRCARFSSASRRSAWPTGSQVRCW